MAINVLPSIPFERDLKRLLRKVPTLGEDLIALEENCWKNPRLASPSEPGYTKYESVPEAKAVEKAAGFGVITYLI